MDRTNVIDYDVSRGVSHLTEASADVEYYLDVVPKNEVPWSEYYLGISVLSLTFVGLAWIGFEPFSQFPAFGWAMLISLFVGGSAIVHRYRERKYQLGDRDIPLEHQ